MIEDLEIVGFIDLCGLNLAQTRVLIIYEHGFIPSLMSAKCDKNNIGFYSLDQTKIKFAQLFRINVELNLESALYNYNYLIFNGLIYDLKSIRKED